jgi:hypothetical protein
VTESNWVTWPNTISRWPWCVSGDFAITAHSREVIERAGSGGSSCRVSSTLSPGI